MRHLRALTLAAAVLTAGFPDRLTAEVQCPDGSPPPCRAAVARTAPPAPNSVAVLYFDNLSPDTGDAYLAEGLTEAVTARLGQIERLVVKSQTAVRRTRGTATDDPDALSRRLGVSYLVSGTVRRISDQVRIAVELVRGTGGFRMWGEHYERKPNDWLAVEEEIAREVARAIAGKLLPEERAVLAQRPTRSPEAYDRFLQANHFYAQRTPRGTLRSIEHYEAALRFDPRFVAALVRMSLSYDQFLTRDWDYPGLTRDTVLARAVWAADRALQLDSTSAEAWIARAQILARRAPRTLEGAIPAIRRALAVDPKSAEAWHLYAVLLRNLGDDSTSVAAFRKTLAIDPDRPATLALFAWRRIVDRLPLEALRLADSALALDPGLYLAYAPRALARLYAGDAVAARADAETARRLSPPGYTLYADVASALVEAALDNRAAGREHLERHLTAALAQPSTSGEREALVAMGLVSLGESERALDLLERAPKTALVGFALRFPAFDPLRSHPRFQRLVQESRPK